MARNQVSPWWLPGVRIHLSTTEDLEEQGLFGL
jgi:hypothetical protein